jgi:GAF domain-containing protein
LRKLGNAPPCHFRRDGLLTPVETDSFSRHLRRVLNTVPSSTATPAPFPVNYDAVFAGQERALKLVQAGVALEEVFNELVRVLEAAFDKNVVGSLMVLDDAGKRLRHGAAPSLPAIYNRAIDGIEVGNYGTCCAAAHRNEVVITPDIENDPGWAKLKDYPLTIRLLAAWSCPIRAADGRVLGTLGTYFRECRRPTETEQQIVSMLARTAGLAIEQRARRAHEAAGAAATRSRA